MSRSCGAGARADVSRDPHSLPVLSNSGSWWFVPPPLEGFSLVPNQGTVELSRSTERRARRSEDST
ncbi:MAG: hypothetical protein ACREM1_01680, partial [Longimicrobiales bacterium]